MLAKLDIYYRNYKYITNTCACIEYPYYGIWHVFCLFSKCNKKIYYMALISVYCNDLPALKILRCPYSLQCNEAQHLDLPLIYRYGMQRHL